MVDWKHEFKLAQRAASNIRPTLIYLPFSFIGFDIDKLNVDFVNLGESLETCLKITEMSVMIRDLELIMKMLNDLHNSSLLIYTFMANPDIKIEEDRYTVTQKFDNTREIGLNLFMQKNNDYGDVFVKFGVVGIIIRIRDKITRYKNLIYSNSYKVKSESINDTVIDIYNYTTMAMMLIQIKNRNDAKSTEL